MNDWWLQRPNWVMRALSEFGRPTVAATGFGKCAWCRKQLERAKVKYCGEGCRRSMANSRRYKLSNRRERW